MKSQLPRYNDGFLFLVLSLVGQHVGLSALDSDHRVVFYIGPGPGASTDCLLRSELLWPVRGDWTQSRALIGHLWHNARL